MHPCAVLLDEIIALYRVEERALADEDIERAEELAHQRSTLIDRAWDIRKGYPEETLRASLQQIREEQARLHAEAEALHERLRERQQAGRKQARYFSQDRYIHAQSKRAFYFDKTS